MNYIFHYYVTFFIAVRAGFNREDARTLAYASQLVDHSLIPFRVRGGSYEVAATHHFGFWSSEQEETVWMPYHFFPGGEGNPAVVQANSDSAKELLVSALKTRNLYRVGIALHTYADTWAHQGFIGRRDDYNILPGGIPLPPIGHAQAESMPDIFNVRWTDGRGDRGLINNRERFVDAAVMMYKYLATYNRRPFDDYPAVRTEIETMLGPVSDEPEPLRGSLRRRVERGISRISGKLERGAAVPESALIAGSTDKELELNMRIALNVEAYDRLEWRRKAFRLGDSDGDDEENDAWHVNDKAAWLAHEIKSRAGFGGLELDAREGFFESELYRWSEAAREHLATARGIMKQLL